MIEYNKILKADLIEMHKAEALKNNDLTAHVERMQTELQETKLQNATIRQEVENEQFENGELRKESSDMREQIRLSDETIEKYKEAHELNANTIERLMKDRDNATLDRELAIQAASSSFDAMQLMRRKVEQVERDSASAVLDAGTYSASEHKQAIMNALAKLPNIDGELRQMILNTVFNVPLRK